MLGSSLKDLSARFTPIRKTRGTRNTLNNALLGKVLSSDGMTIILMPAGNVARKKKGEIVRAPAWEAFKDSWSQAVNAKNNGRPKDGVDGIVASEGRCIAWLYTGDTAAQTLTVGDDSESDISEDVVDEYVNMAQEFTPDFEPLYDGEGGVYAIIAEAQEVAEG